MYHLGKAANFMNECQGYLKLKESVEHDCLEGQNCFNPNGCDKEEYRRENGNCYRNIKCFHAYCNKFKWIIDRANHYSEKLGIPAEEILNSWENSRDYWYMNYYQDGNQPLIDSKAIKVFDTVEELQKAIGGMNFRCPLCGGISTNPYECNSGVIVSKIKDGKDGPCNWKVYGFLGDLGKGVYVYVKSELRGQRIFMPVAWERESENNV
jgi:hypothetical protein